MFALVQSVRSEPESIDLWKKHVTAGISSSANLENHACLVDFDVFQRLRDSSWSDFNVGKRGWDKFTNFW